MNWKNRLVNKLCEGKRFISFVIHHFIIDDCTYRASALAFTSLLAVVPLMTVGLTILSSFPVFQGLTGPVQDFIFDNFVPATGKVVQNYIQQFSAQVSKLSVWGIIFLFLTALLVMLTIEQAMNRIWRVNSTRRGVTAFLLYWAILSLAPVLLGLSLAASSYLISVPLILGHYAPSILFTLLPSILSCLGFTFLYVVVPNYPVKITHGLWGALIATLLFESAKQAFAFYLSQYHTYQLLYGAFATVPIFFIWVYWVWVITLLGAEISYALAVHHQRRTGIPLDGFSHALLWLNQLWTAQKEGRGLTRDELINSNSQPFRIDIDEMLNQLSSLSLIHNTSEGSYMLSRDLDDISLYWLSQNLPYRFPSHEELEQVETNAWIPILRTNDKNLEQSLNINLNQLFRG